MSHDSVPIPEERIVSRHKYDRVITRKQDLEEAIQAINRALDKEKRNARS